MSSRRLRPLVFAILLLLLAVPVLLAQRTPAGRTYTLLSPAGRRTIPVAEVRGHDMFSLEDLAAAFQLNVSTDTLGAITVTYRNNTVVLTPDQTLASVEGRLVTLPAPPVKAGNQWLVPVEFVSRALAPIYGAPLALRPDSRLIVAGSFSDPRVTVQFEPAGGGVRLLMDIRPRVPVSVSHAGSRLLVKFQADAIDPVLPNLPSTDLVRGFAQVPPSTLAVELGPRFASFSSATQSGGEAAQLALTLEPAGGRTPAVPVAPSGAAPAAPAAPGSPQAPSGQAPPPLAVEPAQTLQTIVIDPGHGGADKGVQGPHGTLEKDLTMTVARRLKSVIEGRLGIRVLLTRDGDETLSADERAALANNNKADLFLSLHANASWRSSTQGAEIYYLGLDRDAAKAGAQATAGAQQFAVLGGGSRQVEIVPWQFAQARFIDESQQFAQMIAQQFKGHVPLDGRGVTQAPLRVLVGANMPAVLVEMGYLSNPDQENQLGTGTFQNAIVQALYNAIVQFRDALNARSTSHTAAGGGR